MALIQESVPSLKRRGRSFSGLCPFHKEKSPSFFVNPERGFFHCFGCQEAGSAVDFLMKLEGLTFPEAVRSLAERAGIEIEEERRGDRTEVDRQKRLKDELYAANNLAAVYFEKMLREHPDRGYAIDELARRGLVPSWARSEDAPAPAEPMGPIDDAVQAFRLGYAPSGWDGLANFLKAQGISPVAAEQVGVLVPRANGTHYDRFRHRLMFAVIDVQGRVIAFSGRALEGTPAMLAEPKYEKPAKYINSKESPIYSKGHALFGLFQARHAIRAEQIAVVVEGNFDVVSLHARGVANVVAPLGTAFTVDQAKLLRRFADSCVMLFDGDAAGRKAVRLSRTPLKEAGLGAKVATLPDGTDPDELVRTRGADAVTDLIHRANGLLEFLIDDALDAGFAEADARERVARVQAVTKLLSEENDPLLRMMAKERADMIAGRIDLKTNDWRARRMSEDTLRVLENAVKSALADEERKAVAMKPGETRESPKNARIAARPPGSAQRAQIVGALLEYPELLREREVEACLDMLEGASARTVASLAALTLGAEDQNFDVSAFLAQLPEAVRSFAAKRMAAPEFETIDQARADIERNASKLRGMMVESDARELSHETARAAGDWDAEIRLALEAQSRVRSVKGGSSARAAAPISAATTTIKESAPHPEQIPSDEGTSHAEGDAWEEDS